jgi:hypothetical protein
MYFFHMHPKFEMVDFSNITWPEGVNQPGCRETTPHYERRHQQRKRKGGRGINLAGRMCWNISARPIYLIMN